MVLQQAIAGLVFLICLGLIFTEKMNRTIAAMAGALTMLIVGLLMGFYTEAQALDSIDLETIGLLLGMMVLVSLLEPTGFFQFLAIWAARISRGKPLRLLILFGTVTTLVSMFLDNVTTVVLIAPVTILICEILGLESTYFLMAEALLSNTGGAATLIGDPPNVLIGSAANLSFTDFLVNSLPIVLVSWLAALLVLRFLFRRELALEPVQIEALQGLNPSEVINDAQTMRRILGVLGITVLFFFLQEPLKIHPAMIAFGGAALALITVKQNLDDTLKRVNWSVLLFFASLFMMVGGLEASGMLHSLSVLLISMKGIPLVWFGILLIWSTALLSAVVDNVPITIAIIPVLHELEMNGMNVTPLWWALVFGAGFGGNATIIGSSANIIVTSLSEKTRSPITAKLWTRLGLPVMLVTCTVASVMYYLLFDVLF
jgi:Na+/H+ antiporter NhaD/arsenite permease-like protein